MKFNFKNVFRKSFLFVGMFVFALGMFGLGSNKAEANTCLVVGTGAKNWSEAANWSGCGMTFPGTLDTVQIPTNVALTLDVNAIVAAVIFDNPGVNSNSLTFGTNSLLVNGDVTMTASTGAGATTLAVGSGSLHAVNIIIPGGISATILSATATGNIHATGNVTMSNSATAQLTTTGATIVEINGNLVALGDVTNTGTMTITGNLTGGGSVVNSTDAILNLNGTTNTVTTLTVTAAGNTVNFGGGAQIIPDYASHTYKNLKLSGTGVKTITGLTTIGGSLDIEGSAVVTTAAAITVATTLTVGSGATLHLDAYAFGVTGASSITGTVDTTTAATGTKTFTGLVTVNATGSFNLTAFDPDSVFSGGITNNSANLMNLGLPEDGGDTFVGDLGGTGAITWEGALEVLVGGTTVNSNTNTVTVIGTLTLSGGWTQAINSTLVANNISPNGNGVLTTTAANTIILNGDNQTIRVPVAGYYNLTLLGTGVKDATEAGLVVNQTLTLNSGTTLSLATAYTYTANKLYFGTLYQKKGTWGSTDSTDPVAAHTNNTYFTEAGTGLITVTLGKSTSTVTTTTDTTYTTDTTDTTTTTTVTCTLPQVLNTTTNTCVTPAADVAGGCSGGNAYNTNTGAVCVNNATVEIAGCGNRNTGFSTATGVSCVGNKVTTASTTYNFGTVTLKNGSKGEAVKELQRFLNDKLSLGLVVDGMLGPKTIAVIKKWQKDNGLVSDGLVGPKTKAMMNK